MGMKTRTLTDMIIYLACIFMASNKFKKFKCDQVEYKLIHSILKDYDSSIRPSLNHNYTLNVTFGLALHQIIDVDERNMVITTNCWLNQVNIKGFLFLIFILSQR
jgi:hypothetical protein